ERPRAGCGDAHGAVGEERQGRRGDAGHARGGGPRSRGGALRVVAADRTADGLVRSPAGMSIYDERPWLAQYDDGMAADVDLEHPNGLAMFAASAERFADRPLIHYFTTPLTFSRIDRMTDAL